MDAASTILDEWSGLCKEMLDLVAKGLILPDFIRFAAVCTAWRSAAVDLRFPLFARLPWLIPCNERASHFTFLDGVSTGVKLGRAVHSSWLDSSSSKGWFIFSFDLPVHDVMMLNPLTEAQIFLPPSPVKLLRCVLSASPAAGDFKLAAIPAWPADGLYLYKSSDKSWTNLHPIGRPYFMDVVFCNDELYALETYSYVSSWTDVYKFQERDGTLIFSFSRNDYPSTLAFFLMESRGEILVASIFMNARKEIGVSFIGITGADNNGEGGGRERERERERERVIFLSLHLEFILLELLVDDYDDDDDDLGKISQLVGADRRPPLEGIMKFCCGQLFMPDCSLRWRSKTIYVHAINDNILKWPVD